MPKSLKILRKRAGLSYRKLRERSGLSLRTIVTLEGEEGASLSTVLRYVTALAPRLGKRPSHLFIEGVLGKIEEQKRDLKATSELQEVEPEATRKSDGDERGSRTFSDYKTALNLRVYRLAKDGVAGIRALKKLERNEVVKVSTVVAISEHISPLVRERPSEVFVDLVSEMLDSATSRYEDTPSA